MRSICPYQQGNLTWFFASWSARRLIPQGFLIDPAVLHDDLEVFVRVGNQIDVVQRIAIDAQKIGKCVLLDHPSVPE